MKFRDEMQIYILERYYYGIYIVLVNQNTFYFMTSIIDEFIYNLLPIDSYISIKECFYIYKKYTGPRDGIFVFFTMNK